MREIKFRMWSFDDKTMYPHEEIAHFIDLFDLNRPYEEGDCFSEPMQYTGLRDKNGTEIYEGDIIRYEYSEDSCWGKAGVYTGHIRFDKGVFEIVHHGDRIIRYPDGTWYEPSKCDDIKSFMSWVHSVEVISNIYANPELLEGAK
jgi:uncharacterized phage protein (TIGR01671 family)